MSLTPHTLILKFSIVFLIAFLTAFLQSCRQRRIFIHRLFSERVSYYPYAIFCIVSGTTDEFRDLSHSGANTQPFPFRIVFVIAPIINLCCVLNLSEFIHSLILSANNRYTAEESMLQRHCDTRNLTDCKLCNFGECS